MHSYTRRFAQTVLTTLLMALVIAGVSPRAQAQRNIDDSDRVTTRGNVHPLARPEFDRGSADPELAMNNMILALSVRPGAQAELDRLLVQQQDPASPNFHQWLTPQEFGLRFGPTDQDIADVTGWLKGHGFRVEGIATGRMSINFSGKVQQVERAFQTNIRQFMVEGKMHHANATDPSLPRALSGLVHGVVSLHDFPRQRNSNIRQIAPDFTTTTGIHFLAPGDFATIYNLNPLYTAGTNGTGQSIAIVGRTDINLSDVQFFRSFFGLPVNDPVFIHNGPAPGNLGGGEETEADLDVEWSGAVARNATINFVISASTLTTDGVDLSAQFIVNNNVASVMSTSFGLCEAALGVAGNNFWGTLWAQAAAQGITSLVSSGDSGAAGCSPSNAAAGAGLAVSGLSSSPNNTAVGGTQFNEGPGNFWATVNNPDLSSALSYIPEIAWNESGNVPGGSGLFSTGGGASVVYLKPAFQTGPGVPADGARDVPDVSLTSGGHDGYLIFQGHTAANLGLAAVGGTSAASPSFAGIMALVVQKTGVAQGNANPVLYSMARNQFAGGTAVFHDTTAGNNSVPGVAGFSAGVGYDEATGWGSVDATSLVNFWNNNSPVADFSLSAAPALQTVVEGNSTSYTITVTPTNGYTGTVSFSASGLPAGATATFVPASVTTSGASTLTISTLGTTPTGTFSLTITGTDGTITHTTPVTLVVNGPPDFSVSAAPASQSAQQGTSATYSVTASPLFGFTGTISFSVTGLPTGATATFTPASVVNSGTSTMTVSTSLATPTGSFILSITGTSGALSHTTTATLVVTAAVASDFTISAFPPSQSVAAGSNTGYGTTIGSVGGFSGVVTLSVSGLPAGATGTFSPATITSSGTATLTIITSSTTPTGTYPLVVTGTSGATVHSSPVSLTVTAFVPPPPPPPPPPPTATISVAGNAQVPVPNVNQAGNIVWTISNTTQNSAPNVIFQTNVPSNATANMQLNTITVTVNNSGAFVCTFTPTAGPAVPCASAPAGTGGGTITVTTPSLGGSTKNGNKPPQTMIVTVNVTNPAGTVRGTVFNATGTMTFGPGGVDTLSNTASVRITSN